MAAPSEARAAKNATKTIPIVGANLGDPVASGLVESFARPGGNITGFSNIGSLAGKRLELLKETIPKLARVAVLWQLTTTSASQGWNDRQLVAQQLGLQLHSMEVKSADKFENVFKEAIKAGSGALAVSLGPLINSNQKQIAELAAKYRLPAVYARREFVDNGGLMSYGGDRSEPFKRVAVMVDKIVKGTKPADIPVEQPTKFEFIINLKAAKQIGLTIPPNVLARADQGDQMTAVGNQTSEIGKAGRTAMTKKIIFLALCSLLLAPCSAVEAQQPKRVPRIGFLEPSGSATASPRLQSFRQGLHELGYVEGKTIAIEYRSAEGKPDQLAELAAELVRLKVDIIFALGSPAIAAAKNATQTIPVVMSGGDPIRSGLVASLARPGGNVTGLSNFSPDLAGKRLELLKEIVPRVSRIAALWNPESQLTAFKDTQAAAGILGVQLQSVEVKSANDIESAFRAAAKGQAGAVTAMLSASMFSQRTRTAEIAAKHKLPTMYSQSLWVEAGGLMSYGTHFPDLWRRAATYVDKILKGAKPADLPVEQPTKFELIINLKAAKQIGLTIPPNVLARADRVIK